MDENERKLGVLTKIAKILNDNNIVWAVGGSLLLLYFRNKTDMFHDIDIMVIEDDIKKLKSLLEPMGIFTSPHPNKQYKTRYFLEFTIDNVDVDIMAGFVIVNEGKEFDCSLNPESIVEHLNINGADIPLQSIDDWRRYYALMGRNAKVEMIDR